MNKLKIKLTQVQRAMLIMLLILMCLFFIVTVLCDDYYINNANAATYADEFDNSDVEQELKDSNLDFSKYPLDGKAEPQLIHIVEWKYSVDSVHLKNYGLYFYIYNPAPVFNSKPKFDYTSVQNKVMLATKYNTDGNDYVPSNYEKFNIKLVSKSSREYPDRFLKYKLVDRNTTGGLAYERGRNNDKRRYDVSGIELLKTGANVATEYGVGRTSIFSGYAKGMAQDVHANSTLECKVEKLDTIKLNVGQTSHVFDGQTANNLHKQVNTAYFSVPKKYLREYGSLQRIKAEWYEYQTVPIYIKKSGVSDDKVNDWNKNVFYFESDKDFTGKDNIVTQKQLSEYIYNYNKSYNTGRLTHKTKSISNDLFTSDIPNSRKIFNEQGEIARGYSCYDFDFDLDTQNLQLFTSLGFWESTWTHAKGLVKDWNVIGNFHRFLKKLATDERVQIEHNYEIAPIQPIRGRDFAGTDTDKIAKDLCISRNKNEQTQIKAYVDDADDNDKQAYLFRFAINDYSCENVMSNNKIIGAKAQTSVFLDFDILQLTFKKDDVYTVIPCVSSPLDVINGIGSYPSTPPKGCGSGLKGLKQALIALGIIIFVLIFWNPICLLLRVIFAPLHILINSCKKKNKKDK